MGAEQIDGLLRGAQAVGGVHCLHNVLPLLVGHHDGHDVPLGGQLQVIAPLQLLHAAPAGLDDGAAPGALLSGGDHDLVGAAPDAGDQDQTVLALIFHGGLPSVSFFVLLGVVVNGGGGQIVHP